jgi:hypothetical protein
LDLTGTAEDIGAAALVNPAEEVVVVDLVDEAGDVVAADDEARGIDVEGEPGVAGPGRLDTAAPSATSSCRKSTPRSFPSVAEPFNGPPESVPSGLRPDALAFPVRIQPARFQLVC